MKSSIETLKPFLNKEVNIFPGDSYSKRGIVKAIDEFGILFLITHTHPKVDDYKVGKLHFINHSCNIKLSEI